MNKSYQNTRELFSSFIRECPGISNINEIDHNQKHQLISTYILEMDDLDTMLDGSEPNPIFLSKLIRNPNCKDSQSAVLNNIVNIIFDMNHINLQKILEEEISYYLENNPYASAYYINDWDDFINIDNKDRGLDMNMNVSFL